MRARAGKLLAISTDELHDAQRLIESEKLPFAVLSAAGLPTLDEYGLAHPEGGLNGETIAVPAELLVDPSGAIVWQHVAHRITDRADPKVTLAEVERLFPPRP